MRAAILYAAVVLERLGLWLCRRGLHPLLDGNCGRCGYRWHGGHVGPYAEWQRP